MLELYHADRLSEIREKNITAQVPGRFRWKWNFFIEISPGE
jgi:hypothetical protein